MTRVQIVAGALLLTVSGLGASGFGGAAVAATNAPSASIAGTCQVSVDRSQAAGSFRVDRQTLSNGECVCYVYTGPTTQGAAAEGRIADLAHRRDCGATATATLATSAGDGDRKKKVPLYLALGLGGGGIIAAIATSGGNSDSTGG